MKNHQNTAVYLYRLNRKYRADTKHYKMTSGSVATVVSSYVFVISEMRHYTARQESDETK
jgi:hypothetical protein